MKQACHTDPAMPSQSLIKAICHPEAYKFVSKATQWGCSHEAIARDHYKSVQCGRHQSFSLKSCGLVLNPDWPHLGASPDGIVKCKCCGQGVLEVKCPFCGNDEDVEVTASSSKSCLVRNPDGCLHLDQTHTYYYQVQTQIFICNVDYCDFCVCTFPDQHPTMHIERIFKDTELWKSCTEKTTNTAFYQNLLENGTLNHCLFYVLPLILLLAIPSRCTATAGIQNLKKDLHHLR